MAYRTPKEEREQYPETMSAKERYQSNAEGGTITIQQDWMKDENKWEDLLNQMGITDEQLLEDGWDYYDIEEIEVKIDVVKITHRFL